MKNKLRLLMIPLTLLLTASSYADGILATENSLWHPVIGVGAGVAITTNLGQSQTFPILNPTTDEYYIYSPTNQSQTAGLFEIFLGAEHRVLSNWLFQGGLAYSQSGNYKAQGNFIQGADLSSADQYTYQYRVAGRELLAQAKLMRSYHDKFYPYVLAGIGGSFNQASSYRTSAPPFLTFTREYANNTSGSFAYRVGLGVDMDLMQHIRLGLAYRFSGLGNVGLGAASIDDMAVSGTLSQSNLYVNEVLFQLTYVI
jgi:opacity protein-like surface antigen